MCLITTHKQFTKSYLWVNRCTDLSSSGLGIFWA